MTIEGRSERFLDMKICESVALRALRHIGITLWMVVCWAASSIAQIDAEQVINIGRNVLSMEDYMLSIQYFNQAIKAKPYLAEPYFLRAYAKLSLEDYEGAEEDCTLSIERNKFKTESYRLRGFARQALRKDSLAVEDYNIGLQYNPQDKYFLYYKSVALTELKKYMEADSTFRTLLRLYPKFEEGYTARGRLRTLQGDTVAALEDIDMAIKCSATSIQPYLIRADISVKRHQWEQALADMDEAIRLKPHEADYYLNRAFIRYNMDDYFGAMSDYNYTLELQPYNTAALFNRALLRYEVKDLNRAAKDFSEVLKLKPDNFHACYNLGLVNLERGEYRAALDNFDAIARRYPRFYPVYYARAEALNKLGNTRGAMISLHQGDELVKAYVKNPERNPLDRPTIDSGKSNDGRSDTGEESEEEIMNKFNQLVTSSEVSDTQLSYNDRIKGRVQDRDINVELEPTYIISTIAGGESLKSTSNYFRALDEFNRKQYIGQKLYLTPEVELTQAQYEELFTLAGQLEETAGNSERPADWLMLGVTRALLKDSEAALRALDRAIELYPDFTPAYMERGYARQISSDSKQKLMAIADYDQALRIDPSLTYAWHNKGNIYYQTGDLTSALSCYSEALAIDPQFASALYNRGITYLRMGNRAQAFADLSKAGELGVLASYNLLKRMK